MIHYCDLWYYVFNINFISFLAGSPLIEPSSNQPQKPSKSKYILYWFIVLSKDISLFDLLLFLDSIQCVLLCEMINEVLQNHELKLHFV